MPGKLKWTHKAATLTGAEKGGQPKTEGVQVVEGARRRTSVQKVKLEHLEEKIINLWHYVFALRLRLKDD